MSVPSAAEYAQKLFEGRAGGIEVVDGIRQHDSVEGAIPEREVRRVGAGELHRRIGMGGFKVAARLRDGALVGVDGNYLFVGCELLDEHLGELPVSTPDLEHPASVYLSESARDDLRDISHPSPVHREPPPGRPT